MSNFNKILKLYNPLNGEKAIVNIITPILAIISFFVPYESYIQIPINISARNLIGFMFKFFFSIKI
jgi:hypothetical protein